ncbi:ankyrin repeat domain-containing protein [Flavobacterium cerinum]|uniref:Ankyrin repeat domain-containing protein n=1 Tax=Flavobacterium cerinum TaxID=2502784 RepID=A0A444HBG0_9FLAO|nr:ankyrin repeat domain-containing protein [Flavobacterium cerinum]RWX00566.1 ankyrin repeat domain-containing protein [Flavobacterium cerinum]
MKSLKHSFQPPVKEMSLLMFATMFVRNQIVCLLLEIGANRTIEDYRGLPALDLAQQQGNIEEYPYFKDRDLTFIKGSFKLGFLVFLSVNYIIIWNSTQTNCGNFK